MPNENAAESAAPAEVSGFQTEKPAETAVEPEGTKGAPDTGDEDVVDDLDLDDDEDGDEGDPVDDGADAKKLVTSLRRKAARNRVAARNAREEAKKVKAAADAAVAEAAKQAAAEREQIGRTLAEAFGVIPKGEKAPDPVEVAEAAKAQAEAAQTVAQKAAAGERAARVQLAVIRTAGDDVDADALLDSTTFLNSLDGLDPADKEFKAQLKDAIDTAVENSPRFRKAKAKPAGRSGADLSAGSAATKQAIDQMSVPELIAERRKKRGVSL